MELVDFSEPLRPEDTPIKPGESYVFKIPEEDMEAFESHAASVNLTHSGIRRVHFFFNLINFGDKTGFMGVGGTPIPNIRRGPTSRGSCGAKNCCLARNFAKIIDFYNPQMYFYIVVSHVLADEFRLTSFCSTLIRRSSQGAIS